VLDLRSPGPSVPGPSAPAPAPPTPTPGGTGGQLIRLLAARARRGLLLKSRRGFVVRPVSVSALSTIYECRHRPEHYTNVGTALSLMKETRFSSASSPPLVCTWCSIVGIECTLPTLPRAVPLTLLLTVLLTGDGSLRWRDGSLRWREGSLPTTPLSGAPPSTSCRNCTRSMVKGGKSTCEIKVLVSGGRGLTGTFRTSVRVDRAVSRL
jgi:hypothetical protein